MTYQNLPTQEDPDEARERGRPPFVPTDQMRAIVKHCKASGMPNKDIRYLIHWPDGEHISLGTLTKYFSRELEAGKPEAIAKVSSKLFQKALDGDLTAMIFWLKTQARWKETTVHEHTGADGEPLAAPSLGDFYATVQMVPATMPSPAQQSEQSPGGPEAAAT